MWYQSHVGLVWTRTRWISYLYANGIELPSVLVVLFRWLFSRCIRHVWKYCRYLFRCSILLGGSELSGREAAYSRCYRGIFWMEILSWLWLWFWLSMRNFWGFARTSTRRMIWFRNVWSLRTVWGWRSISTTAFMRGEILILWCTSVVCLMTLERLRWTIKKLCMIGRERAMDLGSHTTRIKGRRKRLVEALSRMYLMSDALSVELWVTILMNVRRDRVATSVGRKVISCMCARARLLNSIKRYKLVTFTNKRALFRQNNPL